MAWKLVISNSHLRVEYVYVKCNQQLTKYKSETQYNNTNYKIKPYVVFNDSSISNYSSNQRLNLSLHSSNSNEILCCRK